MATPWKNITSGMGKNCKMTITWLSKGKVKGKVHPITGREQAHRGRRGIALLVL